MSQAALSVVANAFAPIGLADVVFRAGKDVIELLLKIHDAPTELSHLISSIQVLESAIAEARAYLHDFAASRFVSDDHAALNRIAYATTAGPNDSWFLLSRKKAVFALKEKDIERCQKRLERYAYALDTALSVNKGKNQIHIRNQLSAARKDVGKASDMVLQHIDVTREAIKAAITTSSIEAETKIQASMKVLEGEVTTSANSIQGTVQLEGTAIRHDLHVVATAVEKSVTLAHADIEKAKSLITDRSQSLTLKLDAAHASMQRQVATSTSQQRQGFAAIQKGLNRNHVKQSTAMGRQLRETHRNGRQLKQIHETVMHLASITITESTDNGFELSAVDAEKLMFPLTLIKSQLTKVIPTLTNVVSIGLSAAEFGWVQQEFHGLLAQASLSQYHSAKRASRSSPRKSGFHRQSYRPSFDSTHDDPVFRPSQWEKPHSRPRFDATYSLDTPVGTLCLSVYRSNGEENLGETDMVTKIRFAFLPRIEFCNTGFITLSARQQSAPPSFRHIHVYNILPKDLNAEVFHIILEDNVLAMQDLLSRRKLSPSDSVCDPHGVYIWSGYRYSLALCALVRNSHRTFNLLLQQGAHVKEYSGSSMYISSLLPSLSMDRFQEWSGLISKALEAGFDIPTEWGGELNYIHGEYVKQAIQFVRNHAGMEDVMTAPPGVIVAIFSHSCMDCDDPGHEKYELVESLIKKGAEVNDPDYRGRNALHSLVEANHHCVANGYHRRAMQLMLKSGCDPNAPNEPGMAPIDHITYHKELKSSDMLEVLEELD